MLREIISKLDKSAWKTDNKAWLEKREKAWEVLEPKLEKGRELSKQDIAVLKRYFFYGEDYSGKLSSHNLIEVLYMHPDQSDENLLSIINFFDEHDERFFRMDMYMYTSNDAGIPEIEPVKVFKEKRFGEEGILNGKESFYARLFTPDLSLEGKSEQEVKKVKNTARGFFESFCTSMYNFLLSDAEFRAHKYRLHQYQIETWLLSAPFGDYGKRSKITLNRFLHQLYYWEELNPDIVNQPERHKFVTTIHDVLDNRELPDKLHLRWQMIKTENGRYDPFVVQDFIGDRPKELWDKFNLKGI